MAKLDQASKAEVDSKVWQISQILSNLQVFVKKSFFSNSYCSVIVFGCSEIAELRALLIYEQRT